MRIGKGLSGHLLKKTGLWLTVSSRRVRWNLEMTYMHLQWLCSIRKMPSIWSILIKKMKSKLIILKMKLKKKPHEETQQTIMNKILRKMDILTIVTVPMIMTTRKWKRNYQKDRKRKSSLLSWLLSLSVQHLHSSFRCASCGWLCKISLTTMYSIILTPKASMFR